MLEIENIRKLCQHGALRFTNHILVRLLQRGIQTDEVEHVLLYGEIIEQYPTDYPYPSGLIFGATQKGEPLHVVCGVGEEELWLITAYHPDPDEWSDDFKNRKEMLQ